MAGAGSGGGAGGGAAGNSVPLPQIASLARTERRWQTLLVLDILSDAFGPITASVAKVLLSRERWTMPELCAAYARKGDTRGPAPPSVLVTVHRDDDPMAKMRNEVGGGHVGMTTGGTVVVGLGLGFAEGEGGSVAAGAGGGGGDGSAVFLDRNSSRAARKVWERQSAYTVRKVLTVLSQHNLLRTVHEVTAEVNGAPNGREDEGVYIYRLDCRAVLRRLYFPSFLWIAGKIYGKLALPMLAEMILRGRADQESFLEHVREHVLMELRESDDEDATGGTTGSSSSASAAAAAAGGEADQLRDCDTPQIRALFEQMARHRVLVPVPTIPNVYHVAGESEDELVKASKPTKTIQPKKKKKRKNDDDEDGEPEPEEADPLHEAKSAAVNRHPTGPSHRLSAASITAALQDPRVVWCLGTDALLCRYRNAFIVAVVQAHETAQEAHLVRSTLALSWEAGFDFIRSTDEDDPLRPNHTYMRERAVEQHRLEKEEAKTDPEAENAQTARSLRLLRGTDAVLRPLSAGVTFNQLRTRMLEEEAEGNVPEEAALDPTENMPSRALQDRLHRSISFLMRTSPPILVPLEVDPQAYSVHTQAILESLKRNTLVAYIGARYGSASARICELLLTHEFVPQSTIGDMVILPPKTARETAYRLFADGWISTREVPKKQEWNNGQSIFLYTMSLGEAFAHLTQQLYQAAYNVRRVRHKEMADVREMLENATQDAQHSERLLRQKRVLEKIDSATFELSRNLLLMTEF